MAEATAAWSDLDCFALPPLAPYAVSGCVTVCPLNAASGTPGPSEVRTYMQIDLDAWARDCLADLDTLSTEPFASIVRQFAAAPGERLQHARNALAETIAAGLQPIRADAGDADTLGAARALLARRLRRTLADAYRIAAVVKVVDRLLLVDAGADDAAPEAAAEPGGTPPLALPSPALAPPLALRAIPARPLLVAQSAHFASNPASVAAALTYEAEWQFECALFPHDRIDVRIDLNTAAPTLPPPVAIHEDSGLLAVLAQHQTSRDALWTIVGALTEHDGAPARDPDALERVIDGCAALAERLGETWNEARARAAAPRTAPAAASEGIAYAIAPLATADSDPNARDALSVECITDDGRCIWPLIDVIAGDGTRAALLAEAATGSTRVYRGTADSRGPRIGDDRPLQVRFSLPSLSLVDVASIWFAAGVTRNAQLFGRDAPPSDCAFVCGVPLVVFPLALQPSNVNDGPIDIGEWPRGHHELARNPLTRPLDSIFRDGSTITHFGLKLTGVSSPLAVGQAADPLPLMRPLGLLPPTSADQHEKIVGQLIDELATATGDMSPGGLASLVIELTLYADDRLVLGLRRLQASLGTTPG